MPFYRIIFPPRLDEAADEAKTERIDSGDEIYGVGSVIVHHGKRYEVTTAQLDQEGGAVTDLMVWPLEP